MILGPWQWQGLTEEVVVDKTKEIKRMCVHVCVCVCVCVWWEDSQGVEGFLAFLKFYYQLKLNNF